MSNFTFIYTKNKILDDNYLKINGNDCVNQSS